MNRTQVAKLKARREHPPVTRTSSRVKALALVARPVWQHGTVVRPIPPMATSAPSSRWEDSESASPGPAPKLWIPLSSTGAMPALSHLTEQALHRAGHDRAQKAQLCVATVAQSTCPRSTPGGSARGYQGADRPLSRPVCPNK